MRATTSGIGRATAGWLSCVAAAGLFFAASEARSAEGDAPEAPIEIFLRQDEHRDFQLLEDYESVVMPVVGVVSFTAPRRSRDSDRGDQLRTRSGDLLQRGRGGHRLVRFRGLHRARRSRSRDGLRRRRFAALHLLAAMSSRPPRRRGSRRPRRGGGARPKGRVREGGEPAMGAMRVLGKRVAQDALALLRDEEEGATLVEYGLLAGLVAIAAIGAVSVLGDEMRERLSAQFRRAHRRAAEDQAGGKVQQSGLQGKAGKDQSLLLKATRLAPSFASRLNHFARNDRAFAPRRLIGR